MTKTRQPIGIWHIVAVEHAGQTIAVKFRPDQRVTARAAFIKACFLAGYIIPFDHAAFAEIEARTWRPVK